MVSRVATTRPRLYQGSVRSVRSAICARVLPTGASETFVIQRPRCLVRDRVRDAQPGGPRQNVTRRSGSACDAHELIPVSLRMPHQRVLPACETDYTPRIYRAIRAFG